MDYVTEAKRHVDMVMAILEIVNITADVTDHHIQTFTDIYANGLDDAQREEVTQHIKEKIKELSADFLRVSANLLFFNDVSHD